MPTPLPQTSDDFKTWPWAKIDPYFQELTGRTLTPDTLSAWMKDWTRLAHLVYESFSRLYIATTLDTTDEEAQKRFHTFLEEVRPQAQAADQKLKEKLLDSGLEPPEGFDIPMRNMRAEAALFREENLPLLTEEQKRHTEYDVIIGAQTVEWEGEEVTLTQLGPVYQEPDRDRREKAWRLSASRRLQDREAINALWGQYMGLRKQIAANAGYEEYRSYAWQDRQRFAYTPADSMAFCDAIEEVVVPAAKRIYERRQQRLGVDVLRPWDLSVDPHNRPALKPFEDPAELEAKVSGMFHKIDPALGEYFDVMRNEGLLDLDNRKGKAPGAYCDAFPVARRPFIFENAVGMHGDVVTLLHEAGHAFHVFATVDLPYHQLQNVPMEFAEVASMTMEYLGAPYLVESEGGFYTPQEAARARIEHLEDAICFWPYMAVVVAFQHWVYENHEAASDPANCDAQWVELWDRFMQGVDWTGLEVEKETGWQRKLHIHQVPFYYIEYGLAQLGAVQIWANSLKDQAAALSSYRKALSLGGAATLPQLFETAGGRLAFDAATLGEAVALMEKTIENLTAP